MGYMFATSPCIACGNLFTYAPTKVPSIPIDGVRQPICRSCVDVANPMRVDMGLEPIVPLPGAYEPEEE